MSNLTNDKSHCQEKNQSICLITEVHQDIVNSVLAGCGEENPKIERKENVTIITTDELITKIYRYLPDWAISHDGERRLEDRSSFGQFGGGLAWENGFSCGHDGFLVHKVRWQHKGNSKKKTIKIIEQERYGKQAFRLDSFVINKGDGQPYHYYVSFYDMAGELKTATISQDYFDKPSKALNSLREQGFSIDCVTDFEYKKYQSLYRQMAQELTRRKLIPQKKGYLYPGWQEQEDGTWELIHKGHPQYLGNDPGRLEVLGDKQTQIDILQDVFSRFPGTAALASWCVMGMLKKVVLGELDTSPILNIVGPSSMGKTTIMRILCSMIADPWGHNIYKASSTEAGTEVVGQAANGIYSLVEEYNLFLDKWKDSRHVCKAIMLQTNVANRVKAGRCDDLNGGLATNIKHVDTVYLSSSNADISSRMDLSDAAYAARTRAYDVDIEVLKNEHGYTLWPGADEENLTMWLDDIINQDGLKRNYGHCFQIFVDYIRANRDALNKYYREKKKELFDYYKKSGLKSEARRVIAFEAGTITALLVLRDTMQLQDTTYEEAENYIAAFFELALSQLLMQEVQEDVRQDLISFIYEHGNNHVECKKIDSQAIRSEKETLAYLVQQYETVNKKKVLQTRLYVPAKGSLAMRTGVCKTSVDFNAAWGVAKRQGWGATYSNRTLLQYKKIKCYCFVLDIDDSLGLFL